MSLVLEHQHFPSYRQLDGDGVTLMYWRLLFLFNALPDWVPEEAILYPPTAREHHWSFMAEITDDTLPPTDPCRFFSIKDRDGNDAFLCIQENEAYSGERVVSLLKNGSTVFVRYAYQRWINGGQFTFSPAVLVHKRPDLVHVVPCTLASILEAHGSIAAQRVCSKCGAFSIRRCNRCKQAFYCTIACETNDSEKHGRFCLTLALSAPATDPICYSTGPVPFSVVTREEQMPSPIAY